MYLNHNLEINSNFFCTIFNCKYVTRTRYRVYAQNLIFQHLLDKINK